MQRKEQLWVAAAFLIPFVVTGVSYWRIPYAKLSLPDSLIGAGLLVAFIGAALLRGMLSIRLSRATLVSGLPAPAVVFVRVAIDVLHDRTSHNLWPLELIIASVLGFGASFAGALLGAGLSWLFGASSRDRGEA